MKRVLLLLLTAVSLTAAAQSDFKFGYLSYQAAIEAMPEYATAQTSLTQLKTQYAAEQQRVETEFNAKYEEFLDGQKDFPPTILQKRQTELQELLDRNIAFKQQSQQLLAQAEEEALKPLRTRLNTALAKVGAERGYAFILNTDQNAAPYLNPALGEDVSAAVQEALSK